VIVDRLPQPIMQRQQQLAFALSQASATDRLGHCPRQHPVRLRVLDQFACAYSESAEPTAEAIGDLICEALESAAIIF
jgi:hypothetical protein